MKRAPGRDWARLGTAARAVRESADRLVREDFVERAWRRDAFLWKSDEKHRAVIENALG